MSSDPDKSHVPLILFSGMGADATVFEPQRLAFPNLTVPSWPRPEDGDDLSTYCARLAAETDPGCPCFVGGASFGGIVALEVAQHLDARACFLIGSVRSPKQLPPRIRILRSLGFGLGLIPIAMLQHSIAVSAQQGRDVAGPHLTGLLRQFSSADADVLRWSARQILNWNATYDDGVPVFHIHGDRDRVFPIRYTTADEVVPGGGHVISLTHGAAVNAFLRKHLAQFDL